MDVLLIKRFKLGFGTDIVRRRSPANRAGWLLCDKVQSFQTCWLSTSKYFGTHTDLCLYNQL